MPSVFIIDDEKDICRALTGLLEDEGYKVDSAQSLEEAWPKISQNPPQLILLDVWLEKGVWDGLSGLDRLRQGFPLIPIVMISGHATLSIAVKALQKGAHDFLEKPMDESRVLTTVKHSLELSQLRIAQNHHGENFPTWPLEISQKLKKIAATDQLILWSGEEGSGHLRMAKAIHDLSNRRHGPFYVLNGQDLNTMSPAMWYGQEQKGLVERVGFLESLAGGTLVIQNIHHLTPQWQHYWASIIEGKLQKRLGGVHPIPLNVRLMATTSPHMLPPKYWHPALYQRLMENIHTIPALRQKPTDIPLWCQFFLEEISRSWALPPIVIDACAQRTLQTYPWPGNLHQLYHTLALSIIHRLGASNVSEGTKSAQIMQFSPGPSEKSGNNSGDCLHTQHLQGKQVMPKNWDTTSCAIQMPSTAFPENPPPQETQESFDQVPGAIEGMTCATQEFTQGLSRKFPPYGENHGPSSIDCENIAHDAKKDTSFPASSPFPLEGLDAPTSCFSTSPDHDSLLLTIKDLPVEILGPLNSLDTLSPSLDDAFAKPLKEARIFFEWHYMKAQLAKIDGNIAQAAKTVGMNRAALHRKIKLLQQHMKKVSAEP